MMGGTVSPIQELTTKLKEALAPEEEERTRYRLQCEGCGSTFLSDDPPEETTCRECGSSDLEKKATVHAGGDAGGGAG